MALPDPKRMAATNMISRDSADPGKFIDLLTTLTALGVDAFTGGAGTAAKTAAKAGAKAVKKAATQPGTTTDLKPENYSRLPPLELKPMDMPKFDIRRRKKRRKKEPVPETLEDAIR